MNEFLADLNPEQRVAVLRRDAPLLVLAGPGTGKTRVITSRIAHGLASGAVGSDRIMAITFTNRAAQEMAARVSTLVSGDTRVRIGTFHWMCHAILRRHSHRLGYRRDFRLLGPGEARAALRQAVASTARIDLSSVPGLALAVSSVKNGSSLTFAARRHTVAVPLLDQALHVYQAQLHQMNALDLDDLLRLTVKLLEEDSDVRNRCRAAYDEILVDEYQDVNPVQNQLLVLLAPSRGSLVAVGDEDQAIYGWREANPRSVLRFSELFPGADIVKLEQTYRSTKYILRAARALVSHNKNRTEKSLRTDNPAGEQPLCHVAFDEVQEAEWVARELLSLAKQQKRPWTDFAILYRINVQSRPIEDALLRHGIPYRIHAGHRFYERREIRLAVAYLRLALDQTDDAAMACLVERTPGIGARRLAALVHEARARRQTLLEALTVGSAPDHARLPKAASSRLERLTQRIFSTIDQRHSSLEGAAERAIDAALEQLQEDGRTNFAEAKENLGELRSLAHEFADRKASLRTFVDRLALGDGAAGERSGVSCMSLHAAKGTEYDVVFMVGLEEGLLPHRRSVDDPESLEEERRLCYVGMTRARAHLRLSYAHSRMLAGQALMGHASRFIAEMGRANFRLRTSPALAAKPRLASVEPGQRVVHSRWRDGTVVSVEGRGRETIATVLFDRAGRQRLQLCYAPMWLAPPEENHVLAG
jgi:DNA helicase II / ATP-dependent DNA helicase PcrA